MAKKKTYKDAVRVSFVTTKAQLDRIKYICVRMTTQQGKQVTISDAIRSVIEAAYPVPKNQGDFFE